MYVIDRYIDRLRKRERERERKNESERQRVRVWERDIWTDWDR